MKSKIFVENPEIQKTKHIIAQYVNDEWLNNRENIENLSEEGLIFECKILIDIISYLKASLLFKNNIFDIEDEEDIKDLLSHYIEHGRKVLHNYR